MVALNRFRQYQDLLKLCMEQIQSAPEWLTPKLFCAVAYMGMGDVARARKMLSEFDSRTGPAYYVDGCKQASDAVHKYLQ
jgi:uncharacterized membrane protein SirB2